METNAEHRRSSENDPLSVELSFGQIEAVLAAIYGIAADKRVAFAGRLKALQRNGLPAGDRPGRGKAATFSYLQLMQFAIGVELMQSGMSPSSAAETVSDDWPLIAHSIGYAFVAMLRDNSRPPNSPIVPLDLIWLFAIRGFDDLLRSTLRRESVSRGVAVCQARHLSGYYSLTTYTANAAVPLSSLLVNGGGLILATLAEVTRHQYASSEEITEEIFAENRTTKGIAWSIPPWSIEAERYYQGIRTERDFKLFALDFLNEAPTELKNLLIKFASTGFKDDALSRESRYKLADLGGWYMIDCTDDEGYFLTRSGKVAMDLLVGEAQNDVDPQA